MRRLEVMSKPCPWTLAAALCLCFGSAAEAHTPGGEKSSDAQTPSGTQKAKREAPTPRPQDRSMRPKVGKASIYADMFANRKMANGRPMDPNGNNAASKTLPLGTRALVTNLQTGKSAEVMIEDRGPYVEGRIVDLSPATAEKIGLEKKQGIATVEVRPMELPRPTGPVASVDADGR
jgi:rare lipoprotein A